MYIYIHDAYALCRSLNWRSASQSVHDPMYGAYWLLHSYYMYYTAQIVNTGIKQITPMELDGQPRHKVSLQSSVFHSIIYSIPPPAQRRHCAVPHAAPILAAARIADSCRRHHWSSFSAPSGDAAHRPPCRSPAARSRADHHGRGRGRARRRHRRHRAPS